MARRDAGGLGAHDPHDNTALISQILALPDVKDRYSALGAEPGPGNPDEFSAFLRSEIAKWAKVIRDSGAKVD